MDDRVLDLLIQSLNDLKTEMRTLNDRLLAVERRSMLYAGAVSAFAVLGGYILPTLIGKYFQ